ncbi:histidinol dehydrogenase, partial [Stenotrophomonas maltophilia]|uniref:histidinol dehydrogenase n=1 Tax=Stenotrophomonas maltophilia TaxID=40324 RepID=UPI001953014E
MPIRLDSRAADFDRRFEDFLGLKREVSEDVDAAARAIVNAVAARGDAALFEATQKFDRLTLTPETVRVSTSEIDAAVKV